MNLKRALARTRPNLLRLYPELRLLNDGELGKRLLAQAKSYGAMWVWVVVSSGLAALACHLVINLLEVNLGVAVRHLWRDLILAVMMVAAVLAVQYWTRTTVRRRLRRTLRDLGYEICVNCGYDMRGLPENRCPECGEAGDPSPTDNERADDSTT